MEILLSIAAIFSFAVSVASLAYWLGKRFEEINGRFEKMESSFNSRFREMESSFNSRFREMEFSINSLRDGMNSLKTAMTSINSMLIDFLGVKEIISEGETKFLISEVKRIVSSTVLVNPFTEEDLKFIREVTKKEPKEFSMEEAEKLIEMGKKVWYEDGSELAYKVFLMGLVVRAFLIGEAQKRKRKRKKGKSSSLNFLLIKE